MTHAPVPNSVSPECRREPGSLKDSPGAHLNYTVRSLSDCVLVLVAWDGCIMSDLALFAGSGELL